MTNRIPILVTEPFITGGGFVGSPLTVTSGVWSNSDNSLTYQWYKDDVAIEGETGLTYIPVYSDIDSVISVIETNTNEPNEASDVAEQAVPIIRTPPVIADEDNDNNTITLTHTGSLEVSLKGGAYKDAISPYQVEFTEIVTEYIAGDIVFRVKAEGVNPVSNTVSNEEIFTEENQIDYIDIVLYSKDLDGIDTTEVKVKLINDSVKYKNNVVLRSETLTYTPDATTGKVTMQLPDTDNMEDSSSQYYVVQFTDSAYKIQVPNVSPVDFWDLNPIPTKIRI